MTEMCWILSIDLLEQFPDGLKNSIQFSTINLTILDRAKVDGQLSVRMYDLDINSEY